MPKNLKRRNDLPAEIEVLYDAKFDSYRDAPITDDVRKAMEYGKIIEGNLELAVLQTIVSDGYKISIQRTSSSDWYKCSAMQLNPQAQDAGMMITCEAETAIIALLGLICKLEGVETGLHEYEEVQKRSKRVWR